MTIRIDRCVCISRTFADLLDEAQQKGWGFEQLQCETGAGDQCGLCRPYLRIALAEGRTVFHELLSDEG